MWTYNGRREGRCREGEGGPSRRYRHGTMEIDHPPPTGPPHESQGPQSVQGTGRWGEVRRQGDDESGGTRTQTWSWSWTKWRCLPTLEWVVGGNLTVVFCHRRYFHRCRGRSCPAESWSYPYGVDLGGRRERAWETLLYVRTVPPWSSQVVRPQSATWVVLTQGPYR